MDYVLLRLTPCSVVDEYQHFEVTCRFHFRRFSTQKGGKVAAPEVVAHLPNYRPIDRGRLLP
jgi:nitrite reductase/ring-hydroxylating ferredoxin subunit